MMIDSTPHYPPLTAILPSLSFLLLSFPCHSPYTEGYGYSLITDGTTTGSYPPTIITLTTIPHCPSPATPLTQRAMATVSLLTGPQLALTLPRSKRKTTTMIRW